MIENGERLLSNVVNSQIDIHAEYGGVIPEIAARSHLEVVNPVIRAALSEANCTWDDIDAIAVTYAPGLIGSLLVGTLAARTLAILHNKPLYNIHHVEAHVYANFIVAQGEPASSRPHPEQSATLISAGNQARSRSGGVTSDTGVTVPQLKLPSSQPDFPSPSSSPAATPSSSTSAPTATTTSSGKPRMTPSAKPSIKSPKSSASLPWRPCYLQGCRTRRSPRLHAPDR